MRYYLYVYPIIKAQYELHCLNPTPHVEAKVSVNVKVSPTRLCTHIAVNYLPCLVLSPKLRAQNPHVEMCCGVQDERHIFSGRLLWRPT